MAPGSLTRKKSRGIRHGRSVSRSEAVRTLYRQTLKAQVILCPLNGQRNKVYSVYSMRHVTWPSRKPKTERWTSGLCWWLISPKKPVSQRMTTCWLHRALDCYFFLYRQKRSSQLFTKDPCRTFTAQTVTGSDVGDSELREESRFHFFFREKRTNRALDFLWGIFLPNTFLLFSPNGFYILICFFL